jgi:hypothetical protein
MQKLLLGLLWVCYCIPVFALSEFTAEPTPYSMPIPVRPSPAPVEPLPIPDYVLNTTLDSLWSPKKVRFENIPDVPAGTPVLCEMTMRNSICQANSIHALTDTGVLIKSPLERLTPVSYMAVSNFNNYFDIRIRGTTSCKVDLSCRYLTQ